ECDGGVGASLGCGRAETGDMPNCVNGRMEERSMGCDEQVTGMCQAQTASTPCGDTDGNACTTAGCELNTAGLGVCVQTHLFASNSTPCADTVGSAWTRAGCKGAGAGDQNHNVQVCTTDQSNKGSDTTTGKCTAQTESMTCRD